MVVKEDFKEWKIESIHSVSTPQKHSAETYFEIFCI